MGSYNHVEEFRLYYKNKGKPYNFYQDIHQRINMITLTFLKGHFVEKRMIELEQD